MALAEAESDLGLVSKTQLGQIRLAARRERIDIPAAQALEEKIRHDLMAELKVFARQAGAGGGRLHLGATSADIEDNADIVIYRKALAVITQRIAACLSAAREIVVRHRGTVCMAWTHLQPAEPTTLGYRFVNYAQDLVLDLRMIEAVEGIFLKGKGIKGAVGTSASFKALLRYPAKIKGLEDSVMGRLGLRSFDVSMQTYPRKVDFAILACLASVAQSCHKFGLDVRVMQSPGFGEWSEPFGESQVGSSAMPFKRNPVQAERMCSLARLVSVFPGVGFANAASSMLERTLDDSAARRIVLPEAFLAVDECLMIYERIMSGIRVNAEMIRRNLDRYGPFAGTEAVMMNLVKMGADRQKVHELIRVKSVEAWDDLMHGRQNSLEEMLAADPKVRSKLGRGKIHRLMDPKYHVGYVEERCERFVEAEIDPLLAKYGRKHGRTH